MDHDANRYCLPSILDVRNRKSVQHLDMYLRTSGCLSAVPDRDGENPRYDIPSPRVRVARISRLDLAVLLGNAPHRTNYPPGRRGGHLLHRIGNALGNGHQVGPDVMRRIGSSQDRWG